MATNPAFLSPCGLYCGVCAIHLPQRDDNGKLKEWLVALYKGGTPGKGSLPNSETLTVDDIRCGGCRSDDLFLHCRQCEIRACTEARGCDGCHECAAFPCRHVDEFPMAVGKRVILRSVPHPPARGRHRAVGARRGGPLRVPRLRQPGVPGRHAVQRVQGAARPRLNRRGRGAGRTLQR